MPGKRGSGVKNRGNRVGVNASSSQQRNERGSGAKNNSVKAAVVTPDDTAQSTSSLKDTNTGSTVPPAADTSVSSPETKATEKKPPAKPVAQGESGVLRYPMEALSDTTDYLQIDIVEYKSAKELSGSNNSITTAAGSRSVAQLGQSNARKGLKGTGLATKRLKDRGTIILQMPSQIQDGNSASYGESSLNTLVGAAAGAVKETMTKAGEAIGNAERS